MLKLESFLSLSDEVKEALENNLPVVALETTLVSHGLPYPQNIELATELEEIIRQEGATPATIALIDGLIKVGLNREELLMIGDENNNDIIKASRKDIPHVIAMKKLGATTVSATMISAFLAGISIFATGGIGGAHRDSHLTFDISADLQELGLTNVAVVCSGAKSILDIGKTLEVLETYGVPVIGYQTDVFPAFYTRDSGFSLDCTLNDAESVAKLLHTKWDLGLQGGVVIANPIPLQEALDSSMIETFVERAMQHAKEKNITGKEITPFLLRKLFAMSDGKTLQANHALLKDNARVAAQIAVKYAERAKVCV